MHPSLSFFCRRSWLGLGLFLAGAALAQPVPPAGGVSVLATQQSLKDTAYALRSAYNIQSVAMQDDFDADVELRRANSFGVALSARDNSLSGLPTTQSNHLVLVLSGRLNGTWRWGAYLDQTTRTDVGPELELGSSSPAWGGFVVWRPKGDQGRWQFRFSSGMSEQTLAVTRSPDGGAEPGQGSTTLRAVGHQLLASYDLDVNRKLRLVPYVGLRYLRLSDTGYTEANTVTAPLSFAPLTQDAVTLRAGAQARLAWSEQSKLIATVGVEQDVGGQNGSLTATSASVPGLAPVAFNTAYNALRTSLGLAVEMQIQGQQRLQVGLLVSEAAYASQAAMRLMATGSWGF